MSNWTLHLGDCLDPVTGLSSLQDKSVDHVICDPPYGVGFDYGVGGHDDKEAAHAILVQRFMPHLLRLVRGFVLITPGNVSCFNYPKPRWIGAWIKPGSMVHSRIGGFSEFEPILIYGPSKKKIGTDWTTLNAQKFYPDGAFNGHPCPKPEPLMEWFVRKFTDPGDVILDPFAGSGTTGVAAIRLGRRFIGWEKDPKFHAAASKRLAGTREQLSILAPRTKPKQTSLL